MHVPNLQDSYVQAFCKNISEVAPALIKLKPLENATQNDCFMLVDQHIQEHGGSKVIGWAVWEWPKVMIEAEFHCAWKSPDGELIDISPRPKHFEETIFVTDNTKLYRGRQVNNIRRSLNSSLTTTKYIETANNIFKEMNKGKLAEVHGEIEATPKLMKLYKKMASLQSILVGKYGAP
jgi:hypothetical protein